MTLPRYSNQILSKERLTIGCFISMGGSLVYKPLVVDSSLTRNIKYKRVIYNGDENKLRLIEKDHSVNGKYNLHAVTPRGYMTR